MPWIKSCLCHQEKKKTPTISPPIHLLLKHEDTLTQGPSHAFRCKTFKKPRPCHLCHQPILNEGSCCRVCKYVCHKVCESKEASQRYTDTSWSIYRQQKKDVQIPLVNKPVPENDAQSCNESLKVNGNHANNIDIDAVSRSSSSTKSIEAGTAGIYAQIGPAKIEADVVLHNHDELAKNGSEMNKMIASTSYSNGFGEALTTQPRALRHFSTSSSGIDLSYVTEKIIALWFPPSTNSHSYRQGQRQAAHMLQNKHGDNYMVFNLTEPRRALRNEHKHVKEVGWAQNLAPPLERLCSVCKEIDSWLSVDKHRIAVLHARGNKEKLGVIVAAYMHYSSICGTNEQALDRFSMRKFLDDSVGPLQLPSNKRYVEYFSGLLSRHIKINAAPLSLTHVTVLGAPNFQMQGGCKAFLKIYEGPASIYTSGIYNVSNGVEQFTVNLAGERRKGLHLRGDILIKCYHRGNSGRETVFACQFHTCAVSDYTLSFTRPDLDIACNDSRFPADGAVELHFSSSMEGRHPAPAPTPAVPFTLADDSITRADSPFAEEYEEEEEDSDSDDVNHTFGPLDGSIYASITKKPELSPGAVSSPLTVSMDSGISSAGHQHQNANTTASASPPLTSQPSPLTPEDQHRELDELLSSMMLTVQSIPDLKPHHHQHHLHQNTADFNLDNVRYIDDDIDDKTIPYHARQTSQPFSYGVNSSTMISDSKAGLSSPSLVRKASVNKSSGDTLKKVQTQVYPDYSVKPLPNFNNNYNHKPRFLNGGAVSPRGRDEIDDIFTASALSATPPIKREFREEYYRDEIKPLKRSYTDGTIRRSPDKVVQRYKTSSSALTSPYSDSESLSPPGAFRTKSPEFHESYTLNNKNLTWLQKQQLKLKERREVQLREERHPNETRLMSELRQVQSRHMRPTASHRLDGYTSDTTAFADDDDDYTIPLHINTMQKNGTNNNNGSPTSVSYHTKTIAKTERPFMTVKRAYQQNVDPAAGLAASPLGHIVRSPQHRGDGDAADSGLLSLVEQQESIKQSPRYNNNNNHNLYREESWRSVQEVETSPSHNSSPRPQTPAFPVIARTPYTNPSTPTVQFDLPSERLPPKSPTTQRKDRPTSPTQLSINGSDYYHATTQRSISATPTTGYRDNYADQHSPRSPTARSTSPTVYFGTSRRSSTHSNNDAPQEVSAANVKFVRDTSKYWYKPAISREEAINMLRDQPPGTFVVRDSNSFQGAFGLALKVATLPSNFPNKSGSSDELIRHFLIEQTSRGVRLKGCPKEPVFSSLSALVYQHSVTTLALPCRLALPEGDFQGHAVAMVSPAQQSFMQGAACNVLYLFTLDMEALTGPEAIKKAVHRVLQSVPPETAVVNFKVNAQGITITDLKRKMFFRKHYSINAISHCGLDPEEHRWSVAPEAASANQIFGFIARKPNASTPDNQCHLFAELEPKQPASAIVNFVNKVLSASGVKQNMV